MQRQRQTQNSKQNSKLVCDSHARRSYTTTTTMSTLRRRIFGTSRGDESSDSSRDASPAPAPKEAGGDAYRVIPKEKLEKLRAGVKQKGSKRRNAWIFGLGGLFGLFIAGFFASSSGGLDKLVTMAGLEDMNLDSILDVLPAGLIREVRDLQVCRKKIDFHSNLHFLVWLMLTKVFMPIVS